jgi:hypothetical protein
LKLYFHLRDWQLPGQQDKGASKVEIPTDAAGLCAWLNERRVPISLSLADPDKSAEQAYGERGLYHHPEPSPPINMATAAIPQRPAPPSHDAAGIEDFLLNRATVAECERIFAALGTRFAEARRAA